MIAKRVSGALAVLSLLPPAALALGLGDIRLLSSLNSPLDAEIELVAATPEELANLKAQIASRDTFARYGLDWPPYLNSVTLTPMKSADGRDIIKVRSTESMTEPFLTLLVEVDWARGRLVREYTMLLDPPVFAPGRDQQFANAPVAAPTTGSSAREGSIDRSSSTSLAQADLPPLGSESQAAPLPPPGSSTDVAPNVGFVPASETYVVERGDSLSRLAQRFTDPQSANRWMVATFQGNPAAFDGNMNSLRAGAVLRLPDQATVQSISSAEATAEVRRQYAAWRSSSPTFAAAETSEGGRLRLVTPTEGGMAGGDGSESPQVQVLQSRVQELESQLEESRRLLQLRDAELARLQAQLNVRDGGTRVAEAPPQQVEEPVAAEPAIVDAPSEQVASAEEPPPPAEPVAEEPVAEEPARAATPPERQPATQEGSLLDTLKEQWWLLASALGLVVAFFGFRAWRSRRQADFDDSLGRLASAGAASLSRDREPTLDDAPPMMAGGRRDSFLAPEDDEDAITSERPRFVEDASPAATVAARNVEADDTISSETAINLDQGDPLAEADFHMAYGLYDQAADLVRIAIQREPHRRDLKVKLCDIYFIWGDKEQFLQVARELAETRDNAAPGEWEKIVIMGKQLAPEDPLFSGGDGVSGAVASGVDLNLEGGQDRVDFDLLGDAGSQSSSDVDLDIGTALGESDTSSAATDRNTALDEFALSDDTQGSDETSVASTREMTQRVPSAATGTYGFEANTEAPTVEQPALRSGDPTRQKVEMAMKHGTAEHTAELAIDDLGLDLGALDTMEQQGFGSSPDAPTLVAGLDDHSRRLIEAAERHGDHNGMANGGTAAWNLDTDLSGANGDASHLNGADDPSSTSRLAALKNGELDFDIGSLGDEPAAHHHANGNGVDLDVGTATMPDAAFASTQRLSTDDLALPDLEPVTMSEVGTKLDLARAYMDMGDPEGARNILEEVLQEGSMAQKQEAQRLIESLPG